MKIVLLVILASILSYLGYEYARFNALLMTSDALVGTATPFERLEGDSAVLILGDSLGVGVGADTPTESIAGRIGALYPDYAVENYAVSGARVHDLPAQLTKAKRTQYAFVLIHIGANDIIRFRRAEDAAAELSAHLTEAKKLSSRVAFLTAGDVGRTRFFPWFLNPYYHRATLRYHTEFGRIATETGATYVNLYRPPADDPFARDPERYHAADMLHLSSAGYGLWFERVREALP